MFDFKWVTCREGHCTRGNRAPLTALYVSNRREFVFSVDSADAFIDSPQSSRNYTTNASAPPNLLRLLRNNHLRRA